MHHCHHYIENKSEKHDIHCAQYAAGFDGDSTATLARNLSNLPGTCGVNFYDKRSSGLFLLDIYRSRVYSEYTASI